jgi:hypothetical protein
MNPETYIYPFQETAMSEHTQDPFVALVNATSKKYGLDKAEEEKMIRCFTALVAFDEDHEEVTLARKAMSEDDRLCNAVSALAGMMDSTRA